MGQKRFNMNFLWIKWVSVFIYALKIDFYNYLCTKHIKPSENQNLKSVTPNLVILVPTISFRRVDYYYVFYIHVWCDVNFPYTMSICIASSRRASDWGSRCSADRSCWAGAHWRQLVPLTTFYPIMFFNITNSCICLILMGPNRSPKSEYLLPCLPVNHLGSLLLLYMV